MRRGKNIHIRTIYAQKAQKIVERVLEWVKTLPQYEKAKARKQIKWTGKICHIVELIYAFDTMRCINDGDCKIEELAAYLGEIFGVEIKNCFNTYVDMKKRQGDSRTYFLDDMSRRLNERMNRDDEK